MCFSHHHSKLQIYSVDFSQDGTFFVTAGEATLQLWRHGINVDSTSATNDTKTIQPVNGVFKRLKSPTCFVDVACGIGSASKKIYALAADGNMCLFDEKLTLDSWTFMHAKRGHAISLLGDKVFVAGADATVRTFNSDSLTYCGSFPALPGLGFDSAPDVQKFDVLCIRAVSNSKVSISCKCIGRCEHARVSTRNIYTDLNYQSLLVRSIYKP